MSVHIVLDANPDCLAAMEKQKLPQDCNPSSNSNVNGNGVNLDTDFPSEGMSVSSAEWRLKEYESCCISSHFLVNYLITSLQSLREPSLIKLYKDVLILEPKTRHCCHKTKFKIDLNTLYIHAFWFSLENYFSLFLYSDSLMLQLGRNICLNQKHKLWCYFCRRQCQYWLWLFMLGHFMWTYHMLVTEVPKKATDMLHQMKKWENTAFLFFNREILKFPFSLFLIDWLCVTL